VWSSVRRCVADAGEFLSNRYPVVALSNGNADVQRVGIGASFLRCLGQCHHVGHGQTGPAHLPGRRTRRQAPAPRGEVLHIGDDAHLDGVGALNAGMQMAWVNREWPRLGRTRCMRRT
jgi:hypothetical protein